MQSHGLAPFSVHILLKEVHHWPELESVSLVTNSDYSLGGTFLTRVISILSYCAVMLLTHASTVACVSRLPETKGRDLGVSSEEDYDDRQEGDLTHDLPEEPEQNGHHLL